MALSRRTQKSKTPRRPLAPGAPVVLLAAACVAAALLLAGCRLASRRDPAYCAAPAAGPSLDAEQARYRRLYEQNRPEAPESYQVFPKPPRDNSFAEFDDSLQRGRDAQPELPRLPADSFMLPPPREVSAAPAPPSDPVAPMRRPAGAGSRRSAPADAPPVSAQLPPAGVAAGARFYPVEQLVYGGDHPDIDKPELYRLMPKDVITMTVRDHPEFSGKVEIQPDGTVRVPNAPDIVRLRGQTVEEAAETLRQTIAPYIKGECRVRVQANRARGGYYFVFGDVLQPGRFPMGLEPVKLSDAVLAANWEANPARRDLDGDELGPSFPAASPRGRYVAPPSADLARVQLITPHRSQPVRTTHDVRSAMLGSLANDPILKPGQIVVVPSLVAARNRDLGLDRIDADRPALPEAKRPGTGFSGASTPARLPDFEPPAPPPIPDAEPRPAVEANMSDAYYNNLNKNSQFIMHNAQ